MFIKLFFDFVILACSDISCDTNEVCQDSVSSDAQCICKKGYSPNSSGKCSRQRYVQDFILRTTYVFEDYFTDPYDQRTIDFRNLAIARLRATFSLTDADVLVISRIYRGSTIFDVNMLSSKPLPVAEVIAEAAKNESGTNGKISYLFPTPPTQSIVNNVAGRHSLNQTDVFMYTLAF